MDAPETDQKSIQDAVDTLESARRSAKREGTPIAYEWAVPITTLIGLLRQHLHSLASAVAKRTPSSTPLRQKVLAAIDADISTPTSISAFVGSPVTVVSRTLRELTESGRLTWVPDDNDKRVRRYTRSVELVDSIPSDVKTIDVTLIDRPALLVQFIYQQSKLNIRETTLFVNDLASIGSSPKSAPSVRVDALCLASMIIRRTGGSADGTESLDLAQSALELSQTTLDARSLARAYYERARASLFAYPYDTGAVLNDLDRTDKAATSIEGPERDIRHGWCAYTRALILDRQGDERAIQKIAEARDCFDSADDTYGIAASDVTKIRLHYLFNAPNSPNIATSMSFAISHGYTRVAAECSFWAGELIVHSEPVRAREHFTYARDAFTAVGSVSWGALAAASIITTELDCGARTLDTGAARRLAVELSALGQTFLHDSTDQSLQRSWAAAVFRRYIGVCERYAGDFIAAQEAFDESRRIYRSTANTVGELAATAGLLAARRESIAVEDSDIASAKAQVLAGSDRAPDESILDEVATPCGELSAV
ncbi:hypothetical protein A5766_15150 [Gordonia sp. 852002-51296_SCH5728562-b]|nr:hypothetical protein A5766_15150 [Gordonia sp. 852002-51296_SCH5728562-b]